MQLSRIDLNLFTVFDAIYREGGITPASKRLHLSQPAVSHALGRLREMLDDPLFERHGNEMTPTPLARMLAASIRDSLGNLEQMLHRAGKFEPASSPRRFTIAVREFQEISFLPDVVARLSREAPNVELSAVRIERRDMEDELQSGELDVAIDVGLPVSADVRRELLSSEPLVVLARAEHPEIRGELDLAMYLALEHVLVTGRRRGGGYEDIALGRLGMSRRIRLRCQQHAAACKIVRQTDLLATMTRSQAELVNSGERNQILPFPADIPPMELFLYWHAHADADPAAQWLRALLLGMLRK
jgi:DNA-binding transcriptional LysR family regulator